MPLTDWPKRRKHTNLNYDVVKTVAEAAKVGDQAFHAWRAGQKVFMDIVPGVKLETVDGKEFIWDGEDWKIVESSNVQFNTGDSDLDNLLSFAIDVSNGVAGMEDCDDYGVVLKQVLARLQPA